MSGRYLPLIVGLLAPLGCASLTWGESVERPNLTGSWKFDPSHSELHSRVPEQLTWQIEQSDNAIHLIQHTQERKNADDIRCATDGKDCKAKDEGHAVVVNFYYNGPVLVELESEGQNRDNVVKKRMHVSSDGSTLTVEVIHISPTGRPTEKLVLMKQPGAADH